MHRRQTSHLFELGQHGFDCSFPSTNSVHWIVADNVINAEFIDNVDIALAPEFLKISRNNLFVTLLGRHLSGVSNEC